MSECEKKFKKSKKNSRKTDETTALNWQCNEKKKQKEKNEG